MPGIEGVGECGGKLRLTTGKTWKDGMGRWRDKRAGKIGAVGAFAGAAVTSGKSGLMRKGWGRRVRFDRDSGGDDGSSRRTSRYW